MIARLRARWRRKHETPWRPDVLEWLNTEMERLREHNQRRRAGREGGVS